MLVCGYWFVIRVGSVNSVVLIRMISFGVWLFVFIYCCLVGGFSVGLLIWFMVVLLLYSVVFSWG